MGVRACRQFDKHGFAVQHNCRLQLLLAAGPLGCTIIEVFGLFAPFFPQESNRQISSINVRPIWYYCMPSQYKSKWITFSGTQKKLQVTRDFHW